VMEEDRHREEEEEDAEERGATRAGERICEAKNASDIETQAAAAAAAAVGGQQQPVAAEPKEVQPIVATTVAISFTAREALRTPIFFILSLAIFVVELYWCAVNFNIVALLGPSSPRARLTDDDVLVVMTVMSVMAATTSVVTGVVVERLQRGRLRVPGQKHRHGLMRLVALQMLFACASAVSLCYVDSLLSAVGWVVLFSMMIGIQDIIMLVAFSEIFGADHIGSIMGWVTLVMTLATSSGPLMGALAVDSEATLRGLYLPCAGLAVAVAVCCLCVPDPVPVRRHPSKKRQAAKTKTTVKKLEMHTPGRTEVYV
jgi:MFS family permease